MMINPTDVTLRDIRIGDAGWLIQRHGELYAENEGFDATFDPLVAEILVDFLRTRDTATERTWIAVAGQKRLGSVFCVQSGEPGVAKLRLFLVEPAARGLGLGHRLLDACISFARATGYHCLRLWNHESHQEACALCQKYGFVCKASNLVHSFGVNLVEQSWELDLS